jgi:hypothetical protein
VPPPGGLPSVCRDRIEARHARELVGRFGAEEVTALLEQRAEVERAMGVAEFMGAAVARFRVGDRAPLLEQVAEVQRRGGVTPCIGLPVSELGGGKVATLLEQHSEIEPLDGFTGPIDRLVIAPGHPPRTITDQR